MASGLENLGFSKKSKTKNYFLLFEHYIVIFKKNHTITIISNSGPERVEPFLTNGLRGIQVSSMWNTSFRALFTSIVSADFRFEQNVCSLGRLRNSIIRLRHVPTNDDNQFDRTLFWKFLA